MKREKHPRQDQLEKLATFLAGQDCPSYFGLTDVMRTPAAGESMACVHSGDLTLDTCMKCHIMAIRKAQE